MSTSGGMLDERLEGAVYSVDLAEEMLAARGRDVAEHRDRALAFGGRQLLVVDVVLLQQAMEVRRRRDDADAPMSAKGAATMRSPAQAIM